MSVRNTVCYIFNRGISWLPGLSQHLYLVFSGPADANVVDELLYADNLEDELNDIYAQSGTGISVVIVGVIRLTGYNPGSDFIESQTTAGWLAQTDLYAIICTR